MGWGSVHWSSAMREELTKAEKLDVIRQDRSWTTYHQRAQVAVDEERGGRFAALSKPTVVGATPISYPKLPTNNAFACDPVPKEPPVGYDINQIDIGEPAVSSLAAGQSSARLPADDGAAEITPGPPVECSAASTASKLRRL